MSQRWDQEELNELFDRFWSYYPRRQGANPKKPARQKFERHVKSGVDPEAIIEGAMQYSKEARSQEIYGTPYVAMAQTWLNQERWWREEKDDLPEQDAQPAERTICGYRESQLRHELWKAGKGMPCDRTALRVARTHLELAQ